MESNVFASCSSKGSADVFHDSDYDTLNVYHTNMEQLEAWVLNRDRCHCRVVIRELVPTIARHWKAAENYDNLLEVMIEAVAAAVYMGDSEEAFHWISEIKRRVEEKKQIVLSKTQEATIKYLEGQACFKNGQLNDAIDCYRKSLKLLGVSHPTTRIEAQFHIAIFIMKQMFYEKFQLNSNNVIPIFSYEHHERYHIMVQCLGRLKVALEIQHRPMLACAAAVEQYRCWCHSSLTELSMKMETLANFIQVVKKFNLNINCDKLERKLELVMEYDPMSPDNTMALFYSYLLLAETKISQGAIQIGVEHGSNALLLSDAMKHRLLFVSASPTLCIGFLLANNVKNLVDTLRAMNRFAVEISDNEGQAWFVAFGLFLESEIEEQLENNIVYREFVFSSISSADFTNDSLARYCMLISLALSFARQGNGTRATSWVTVARTLAPPQIGNLTCAFFHTLLFETLILLLQMGFDVKRRLKSVHHSCVELCETYHCLRPRVYSYIAFLYWIKDKYTQSHRTIIRACHYADSYSQHYDKDRLKQCKESWYFAHTQPKNLLNRVLLSKRVHTEMTEEDILPLSDMGMSGLPCRKIYTIPVNQLNANIKYSITSQSLSSQSLSNLHRNSVQNTPPTLDYDNSSSGSANSRVTRSSAKLLLKDKVLLNTSDDESRDKYPHMITITECEDEVGGGRGGLVGNCSSEENLIVCV